MSKLISEAQIRAAHSKGRPIEVEPGQIVTPAARDLARKLGVAITEDKKTARRRGTVVVGSDHGGFVLKEALKPKIKEIGFEVRDVGCDGTDAVDYPVYAARVADTLVSGDAQAGIMIDGAGIGSSMVGNKIAGVRAALCYDITTARNAREHNNANMLTLGGSLIGPGLATQIVEAFLETDFGGGRHQRRVSMIDALDQENRSS